MELPQLGMIAQKSSADSKEFHYMDIYLNGHKCFVLGPEEKEVDLVNNCLLYATYYYKHEQIKPH